MLAIKVQGRVMLWSRASLLTNASLVNEQDFARNENARINDSRLYTLCRDK